MATGGEVLTMLLPGGGWILTGNDYEGIEFIECDPITKEEFETGFTKFDVWNAKKEADAKIAKAALLNKLGITADEAALLLS